MSVKLKKRGNYLFYFILLVKVRIHLHSYSVLYTLACSCMNSKIVQGPLVVRAMKGWLLTLFLFLPLTIYCILRLQGRAVAPREFTLHLQKRNS
jgi:hypothetical protein